MGRLVFIPDPENSRVWLEWHCRCCDCECDCKREGADVVRALEVAAKNGADLCRLAVSTPYPPASKLGSPPALRTGVGRDSIYHSADGPNSRACVGSRMADDFNYEHYHDQNGRPWLLDTLVDNQRQLEQSVEASLA